MSDPSADLAFKLFGTREREPEPIHLAAGKLTAELIGGNLRTIRYDGVEVLRAISYLVRDRDWGTYDPALNDLAVTQDDSGFSVSYTARCIGPDNTNLTIQAKIRGGSDGRLTFEAEALSPTGFETNRCGFCILHPIVGVAGTPVTVEHVDGTVVETHLPELIDPWQPFKDMRAITHGVVPGVTAKCRMEGDTFEMEDQRNWSDASYKTYVRPLALPWPYMIEAGRPTRQRVVLSIKDARSNTAAVAATSQDALITILPGTKQGTMPSIGLIVTPEEASATLAAGETLSRIGVQELLFHFDPLAGHNGIAFRDFAAIASLHPGTTTLEIAVPCQKPLDAELDEIASAMKAAGFHTDAVVVSPSVDRQSTPPGSKWPECPPLEDVYAAARKVFQDVRLGGGMLSYFTELNRKRVPADQLDFVTHCTNPIVHAADDLSVMQTLEALPFITKSVRAIYGDKPYRIGPSTIPMRQNPYGSRTMDNPVGQRIPMAYTDPRHNGRFAEAFAFGYTANVLDAGLERLTLSAMTGPFGLIAVRDEPTPNGHLRPLALTVRTLASLAGAQWSVCNSSTPSSILAFATSRGPSSSLWLVNLTASDQQVDISAVTYQTSRTVQLAPYAVVSVPLKP